MREVQERLNFSGWVMSDWVATHSTAAAAAAGLDQEMPLPLHFNRANLQLAIVEGKLSRAELTAKAVRILSPMFAAGLFDRPAEGGLAANVTSAAPRRPTGAHRRPPPAAICRLPPAYLLRLQLHRARNPLRPQPHPTPHVPNLSGFPS